MMKRPNRAVLNDALDEFRDAMRRFVVRGMRRVRGKTVEDAIYESCHRIRRASLIETYKITAALKVRLTSETSQILYAKTGGKFSANSLAII